MSISRVLRGWIVVSLLCVAGVRADVTVNGLFGDHMVVQRDLPLRVWGKAQPAEAVKVQLGDRTASTEADAQGAWQVRLEPLAAGGPHELVISGRNTLTIHDVLIGEVWVCSGQSNMAFQVQRALNPEDEIAAAKYPRIRLFTVKRGGADEPKASVDGQWQACSPQTVGEFSAVGYFFGRDLQKALDVPIGLINSSVGGTPAESWTPGPVLEAEPDFELLLDRWKKRIEMARAAMKDQKAPPAPAQGQRANARRPNAPARARAASRPAGAATRPGQSPSQILSSSQRPAVLYNAMIHPLIPFAMRGVIWYQGESNAGRAYQYRKLFPTMIRSWRKEWGQGDFPFLFVQLATYKAQQREPYASAWSELREAQTMTLSLPNTGMAVATDIGDRENIHPANKQEVGKRLALAARAIAYGEKIPYSGPMYEKMAVDGDRVRITFKHVDGGLKAQGGALKGFAVTGDDRRFVEADASIDGDAVLVHSEKVAHPVAVRYAWADAPDCNLFNGAGLPASPFRTDDWPGVTANEK